MHQCTEPHIQNKTDMKENHSTVMVQVIKWGILESRNSRRFRESDTGSRWT